ncbi:MAG: hypothetical protein VB877_05510 [Pirellulaceae bacterium]
MQGLAIVLAAASLGVDYGWQPTDDGALEYIIQIEPELLIALQKGESIVSEIHPDATGVRRFRIQIGSKPLPRVGRPSLPAAKAPIEKPAFSVPLSLEPAPPAERQAVEGTVPIPAASQPSLPPIRSEFPIPTNEPSLPKGAARPGNVTAFPPTTFPIDDSEFPVTEPLGVAAEDPAPPLPLPLPASDLTDFQSPPVRKSIVPLPDPDRQPLSGLRTEPAFPNEPLPLDQATAPISDNSVTVIPAFDGTQLATFNKTSDKSQPQPTAAIAADNQITGSPAVAEPRPWFLLSVTILGLLASLGANAYLAYLFMGIQRRYQSLRQQQRLQAH